MNPHVLVGIDGGGTKTHVLARFSHSDQIVFDQRFGSSNYQSIGETGLLTVLTEISQALRGAFGPALDRSVSVLGMAGVDRPEDVLVYEQSLAAAGYPGRQIVCNDAEIALAGAHDGGPGALLLCGTGSIAMGRTVDGGVVRAGGWGALVSDEGSGYRLGIEAISAALRAYDGSGPQTVLCDEICRALKLKSLPDMIDVIYLSSDGLPVTAVASLAPLVTANCGRPAVCRAIVTQQAGLLCDLVKAVRKQIDLPRVDLALGGSLLLKAKEYRAVFDECLARRMPDVQIVQPQCDASHGALRMAAQALEKEGAL